MQKTRTSKDIGEVERTRREKSRRLFKDYGCTKTTAKIYTANIFKFCRESGLADPFVTLNRLSVADWEDAIEHYIKSNEGKLAPKTLRIIYSAVKTWLHANKKIENKRLFRQIKFDGSSNLVSGFTVETLETRHLKQIFQLADSKEKIVIGFYGLCGLRPAIIPQLKVKHIHPRSRTITNGKIQLKKPTLVIVPRKDGNGEHLTGNKAKIDFMFFIPTQIAELIEQELNNLPSVTPETGLTHVKNKKTVLYIVNKYFDKIGFTGNPYRLRNYADGLLDHITKEFNDEDSKELMMGHKGKVSAIYQHKALTEEREQDYRKMYVQAVDKWIDKNIFGMGSTELADLEKKIILLEELNRRSQEENLELKRRLERVEETRRDSDEVMNRLFSDPTFIAEIRKRLKSLQVT